MAQEELNSFASSFSSSSSSPSWLDFFLPVGTVRPSCKDFYAGRRTH